MSQTLRRRTILGRESSESHMHYLAGLASQMGVEAARPDALAALVNHTQLNAEHSLNNACAPQAKMKFCSAAMGVGEVHHKDRATQ